MSRPIFIASSDISAGGDERIVIPRQIRSRQASYASQWSEYSGSDGCGPLFSPTDPSRAKRVCNSFQARRLSDQYYHRRASQQASSKSLVSAEDRHKIENTARSLYQRFRASDQYVKYRERQSDRQHGDAQKWPDRLERAFFQALVRWAPMGRGKVTYKDKLRGRNELIADYIEELTGEVRNRKQVSSHIQVLKPFVIHDSFIMKYLSNEQNRWSSGPLDGGESMSNYSVAPSPTEAHDSVVSLNQIEIDVLSEAEDSLETLEPVDFQMFIQRKHSHTQIERLHTYTAALDYPRQPDMQISNWQMLEHDYPLLARIHSQRPLDCAMFQADASLTVEMDSWNDHEDHNLLGEELGIFFLCRSRDLAPNTQISCRNTFYKNGQCLKEHTDRFPLEMVPSDDGSTVEASVKFGSSFWAEILAYLGSRLLEAEHSENIVREEVATYLQGIKVAQEFFSASPRHGQRERLLVIYWKFGLSNGAYGKTSWRRLNLPSLLSLSSTRDVSHSRSQSIDMARVHGKQRIERLLSQQSQLTLPSPLGYESSSGSGLSSSTTWPNSIDDGGMAVPNAQYYGDFTPVEGYDPSLHCGSFDSAGLNYDLETTSFAANLEVGSMDPMRDTSAITWQAGMGHL